MIVGALVGWRVGALEGGEGEGLLPLLPISIEDSKI
jgi:hypothetical protein